jgi:hypothetical protein
MDDPGLCEAVCRQSTWLAELLVLLVVVLRAAWLSRTKATVVRERDSLEEKVRELSLRPPPAPPPAQVTLQLAPHPGLASLYPIAVSTTPADPQNTEKSGTTGGNDSPEPPDPDYGEPPEDGS